MAVTRCVGTRKLSKKASAANNTPIKRMSCVCCFGVKAKNKTHKAGVQSSSLSMPIIFYKVVCGFIAHNCTLRARFGKG
jgi:hypothetical protein